MDDLAVEVYSGAGVDPIVDPATVEQALRHALNTEGVRAGTFSVAYVRDAEIAELNERFLGHAGATDVISFALHGEGETPNGDVYVGADQALRQAAEFAVPAAEEWLRLAIHGLLHVLGHDHPEGEERIASPMYRRQEDLLARVLEKVEPEI